MAQTEQNEKVFQVYKSSMQSHRVIMPNGKVLHVRKGKYITDNEDEIAFLDAEIKAGFKYLKKAEPMTSSDLDPMQALRKKLFAEFEAEQAAKQEAMLAAGDNNPIGDISAKEDPNAEKVTKSSIVSSEKLAAISAASKSSSS